MKPDLFPEVQESAERQAALCRVFSNPQRILILWLLAERECSVTEIALTIGASLQGTSQHLRIMGLNNILESRREHHNIYYRIADNQLLKECLVLANKPKAMLIEAVLP